MNNTEKLLESVRNGTARFDEHGNLHYGESLAGGQPINLREAERQLQEAENVYTRLCSGNAAAGLAIAERSTGISRERLQEVQAGRTSEQAIGDAEMRLSESVFSELCRSKVDFSNYRRGRW